MTNGISKLTQWNMEITLTISKQVNILLWDFIFLMYHSLEIMTYVIYNYNKTRLVTFAKYL